MQTSTNGGGAEAVTRYFSSRRALIAGALESMAARDDGRAESVGRIVEFCLRGKMIRGCLVLLAADAAGAADDALVRLAAAMELFQAGLLAHDDIMDRDETRRGAPTIHARYAAETAASDPSDRLQVGEALGICLGDLCYFEGFAALAGALNCPQCGKQLHFSILAGSLRAACPTPNCVTLQENI